MKYDRTEIAASGKPRLRIFMSEDDAEILDGLAKTALEHMPQTEKTAKTYERLRSMRRCFREMRETSQPEPFHDITKEDLEIVRAHLEGKKVERLDRDLWFPIQPGGWNARYEFEFGIRSRPYRIVTDQ